MGGANKALLQLQQQTFLSRLENALSDFDEKLISLQDASWLGDSPFLPVFDQVTDRGPMEGLRCSLSLCRSDALLVVACDMPLISGKLAKAMLQAGEGFDAVICQDRAGRIHPLCGIYSKQCLPAIESMIARGNYKITDIMKAVRIYCFPISTHPKHWKLCVRTNPWNAAHRLTALQGAVELHHHYNNTKKKKRQGIPSLLREGIPCDCVLKL